MCARRGTGERGVTERLESGLLNEIPLTEMS